MLYKITNINKEGFQKMKFLSRSEFLKIFTRFMFVNALVKVTEIIDKTGGTAATKQELVKEIPLVLKINQF